MAMKLVHLDDYSILSILDHLSFTDLLQLADVTTRFQQIITKYYMLSKYNINQRLICLKEERQSVNTGKSPIFIGDFAQILRFLRNFGYFITKLEFCGHCYKPIDIGRISHYIVRFSSQSLQELSLYRCQSYLTSDTTQNFPKIQKLRITTSPSNEVDNFQIHQIYPAIKCSAFSTVAFSFATMIRNYPQLECLTLELFATHKNDKESLIDDLFRANTQLIQLNLYMRSPSFDLITFASERLTSLLSLTLNCTLDGFPSVGEAKIAHFPNVREFQMTVVNTCHARIEQFPITFGSDCLEELEIHVSTVNDLPFELIERNRALKRLALPITNWTHEFSRFCSMVQGLHGLKVLELKWSGVISSADMVKLMEVTQRLKEIIVHVVGDKSRGDFIRSLPGTWQVVDVRSSAVYGFGMFAIRIAPTVN